jgi:hypothetical protein
MKVQAHDTIASHWGSFDHVCVCELVVAFAFHEVIGGVDEEHALGLLALLMNTRILTGMPVE